MSEDAVTVAEFGELEGVTGSQVYAWVGSGMPVIRGKPMRIPVEAARAWLAALDHYESNFGVGECPGCDDRDNCDDCFESY